MGDCTGAGIPANLLTKLAFVEAYREAFAINPSIERFEGLATTIDFNLQDAGGEQRRQAHNVVRAAMKALSVMEQDNADLDELNPEFPDLIIAFNVDPAAIIEQWGYSIEDRGKPPDFVLETASATSSIWPDLSEMPELPELRKHPEIQARHTPNDYAVRRNEYAASGIPGRLQSQEA